MSVVNLAYKVVPLKSDLVRFFCPAVMSEADLTYKVISLKSDLVRNFCPAVMSEADLMYKVMSLKSDLVRLYFVLRPFDIFDAACVADHRRSSGEAGRKRLDTEVPASKSMRNTHRSAGDRTQKAPEPVLGRPKTAPRSTGDRTAEVPEAAPRSTGGRTRNHRGRVHRWRTRLRRKGKKCRERTICPACGSCSRGCRGWGTRASRGCS